MPKVDVNTATREELMDVAGLEPKLAAAIIKRRDERGGLAGPDALQDLPGVAKLGIGRLEERLAFAGEEDAMVGERSAEVVDLAARGGLQAVREVGRVVGEVQRQSMTQASQGAADLAKTAIQLVTEQTLHDVQALLALAGARHWDEALRIQADFFQASLARKLYLAHRSWQTVQGVALATALAVEEEVAQAA